MKISQDSELFPYESFGVRLEYKEEKKICWFKDHIDLQKYLERYKLDLRKVKIDYLNDDLKPKTNTKPRKKKAVDQPKTNDVKKTIRPKKTTKTSTKTPAKTTRKKKQ